MLATEPLLSSARVGFASRGSADPLRTVRGATTFANDGRGDATGISAGYFRAVLSAVAAFPLSVGCAPAFNTLAFCSVFAAQASNLCFGGAAFNRAWLLAVGRAEASGGDCVYFLLLLPLSTLHFSFSFQATTICSIRALLQTRNNRRCCQHRTPHPPCQWNRLFMSTSALYNTLSHSRSHM